MISIEDFAKLDIRVGKIIEIEDAETRKPMYKIKVDFGHLGIKQAIAGIKPNYRKEELMNKKPLGRMRGSYFIKEVRFIASTARGLPTTGDPISCEEMTTVQLAVPPLISTP